MQGHDVAGPSQPQNARPTAPPLGPVFVHLAIPAVPVRGPSPGSGPASSGLTTPGAAPFSPPTFASPPQNLNSPPGAPSPPGGRRSPQQVRTPSVDRPQIC